MDLTFETVDYGSHEAGTGMDIAALYRRYGPMVFLRCSQLLRSQEEAEDATQDVFVQLMRHQGQLTGRYASSLLYRIATNVCLNRIRARQRAREEDAEDLLYRIAITESLDSRLLLEKLFRRHPESTRVMAVMHFVDGMTLKQVAQEVGMSVSGVRRRLESLRRSLRELERP